MSVLTETPSQPLDVMSDSDMNMASHTQASKRKLPSEEKQQTKVEIKKRLKAEPLNAPKIATATALIQLRNGKLTLKQKPIEWSRSMSTLSTIIAFNTYLESCKEPLTEIPEEHLHMIARLTQESDKSLVDVAKSIKNVVVPAADEDGESSESPSADQILTLSSISKAIEEVAERVNYGIDDSAAASSSSLQKYSVPIGLQMWRWEVRNVEQLAVENREKLLTRRKERVMAKAEAVEFFRGMSVQERNSLLTPRQGSKSNDTVKVLDVMEEVAIQATQAPLKTPAKTNKLEAAIVIVDDDDDDDDDDDEKRESDEFLTPSPKKKSLGPSPSGSNTSKGSTSQGASPTKAAKSEVKKIVLSPEQEAKQAEKEERKRQRELKRAEKEKKEAEKEAKKKREAQAKAKAASFMSSFIQRPRSASPAKVERKVTVTKSDFEKTFQACMYKDVAPVNRFDNSGGSSSSKSRLDAIGKESANTESLLEEFKAMHSNKKKNAALSPSRKGIHPPISVRESMRLITEASVMGDEKLEENGKRGLSNLSDRKKVPMKLLHFASDRRPAWYGTWTRTTNSVGARKPFGQDPVALDYSYDSEAEWEDEDPNDGDDLLDNDEKEDEDGERSDDDSEMDDWLVDDLEEEEEEEGTAPPEDLDFFEVDGKGQAIVPPLPIDKSINGKPPGGLVNFLQPRKKKIKPIGRRFESKLVPFSTGPHWQDTLGETGYDGFKGYQIEFLNDAQPGLNPFTFESAEPLSVQENDTAREGEKATTTATTIAATSGTSAASGALLKAQTFPSPHLPLLLQGIQGNTSIRPVLVEDLKNKFAHLGKAVTKANIEACVNIYAEKLSKKMGAKWVVKDEYQGMLADVQDPPTPPQTATSTTSQPAI